MCTLAVAVGLHPEAPLLVAANRDESLARPSTGLLPWEGQVPFLAPRDEVAHGSWLGLNARGLFVGLTNRHGPPPEPTRASRGQLVVEALGHPSAQALHAALARLPPTRFNPFHLFYADRHSAWLTWSDGQVLHQAEVGRGLHVFTERSLRPQEGEGRREARVRAGWPEGGDFAALGQLLSTHPGEGELPVDAPCVHVPALGYGTRSSLLLQLGHTWEDTRLAWAEGAPCRTPFSDVTGLLAHLA